MRPGENRMTAQSSSGPESDMESPVARMTDPDSVCSQLISGWMTTWSGVAPFVARGRVAVVMSRVASNVSNVGAFIVVEGGGMSPG